MIQMDGVTEVFPNRDTHPEFADAFYAAKEAGVKILNLTTHVTPEELIITGEDY